MATMGMQVGSPMATIRERKGAGTTCSIEPAVNDDCTTTTKRAATLAKTAMATKATMAADGAIDDNDERSQHHGRGSEYGEKTACKVF